MLQFFAWRYLGDHIDQEAIIGRDLIHIGMGPIGAPQHPPGKPFYQKPRKGNHVVIGRPGQR